MKHLITLLLLVLTLPLAAKEIEFVYYHPPGGSADLHSQGLIQTLEKQNITVKRTWVKSCSEAIKQTLENKNTYMVTLTSDLRYKDSARCPSVDKHSDLRLISTLAETPFLFCAAPHRKDLRLDNISREKNLLIGLPTIDINWIPFTAFVRALHPPLDAKLIPYKGAGDLKSAILGKNVDMFYVSSTVINELSDKGARCMAASTKINTFDLPFLGNLLSSGATMPETALTTALWSNSKTDPGVNDKIRTALAADYYRKTLLPLHSRHVGIGTGMTQQQMIDRIKALDLILSP